MIRHHLPKQILTLEIHSSKPKWGTCEWNN